MNALTTLRIRRFDPIGREEEQSLSIGDKVIEDKFAEGSGTRRGNSVIAVNVIPALVRTS